MKSFRDIRVIPVVLVAIFGLAVLKIAGLVIDGGYVFDYQVSQPAKRSWAQDNLGYPSTAKVDPAEIKRCFKDVLPERELREFRALCDGLHRHFRRFHYQSQA